jgi:uncharacterized protein (DUF1501 family)
MKSTHETNDSLPLSLQLHRRAFLSRASVGVGSLALSSLLSREQRASEVVRSQAKSGGLAGLPHFAPKAKRVIFLYMAGGPSQLEMFDYKPQLRALDGQAMPESLVKNQQVAQLQGQMLTAAGPIYDFQRCGAAGQWISEQLPWHQKMADEICIVRSMVTEQINHDPAHTILNTGSAISGRPSMGSWINYGLGSEADDLPGFVVLTSKVKARNPQPISSRFWSAGFLPSRFQGVEFNSGGDPVLYLQNPAGIPRQLQAASVSAIRELDRHAHRAAVDPELETRIAAYETAFRMQVSVPELVDLSKESAETLESYGATPDDGSFASNCLLARRLAERGVRFIQLYHRDWDHHDGLHRYLQTCCESVDRAAYALVTDLKQRGMLDDTLVVFGGEFGRSPMVQTNKGSVGRDHHIQGFSMWLAGGGVKPGLAYGQTDELGYYAVENPVHVRDLHATMLHLLGIDHQRFTYRFQGLDARLSGVEPARVVKEILV